MQIRKTTCCGLFELYGLSFDYMSEIDEEFHGCLRVLWNGIVGELDRWGFAPYNGVRYAADGKGGTIQTPPFTDPIQALDTILWPAFFATTVSHQRLAIKWLTDHGFVAQPPFLNPNSGNHVTVWFRPAGVWK